MFRRFGEFLDLIGELIDGSGSNLVYDVLQIAFC